MVVRVRLRERVLIKPGLLTPGGASEASRFVRQTEANRRTFERRQRSGRERFPAELTAYDASTGGFTWQEQWYTSAAQRETKPGGRTGTGTAFPYGDGSQPSDLPLEVTLYRRLVASTGSIGGLVAYEFPYYCACEEAGSDGSEGGFVLNECCPGVPIPLTLHVTMQPLDAFNVAVGSPVSWPIVYNSATLDWAGTSTLPQCGGISVTYRYDCRFVGGLPGNWQHTETLSCSGVGGGPSAMGAVSCNPLQVTGFISVFGCTGAGSCFSVSTAVTL